MPKTLRLLPCQATGGVVPIRPLAGENGGQEPKYGWFPSEAELIATQLHNIPRLYLRTGARTLGRDF